ncbi:hypothetical protein UlMin_004976 [Ulmus minor]
MDRMVVHNPAFCDITWGASGSTADLTLDIAARMQNMVCVETMMHLICTNMPVEQIDQALDIVKNKGLQNVLALRGNSPHGHDKFVQLRGGFACALDLGHPDVIGNNSVASIGGDHNDLSYLKKKVDVGAKFITTQMFYDTDVFLKFVPSEVSIALEDIKDNEEAMRSYGIHLGTEMCKKILANGIRTLHLYTLNMEKSALAILSNLGLIEEAKISRCLPWRPHPTNVFWVKEDVRPIFWANRPKSYLSRTMEWDEYPKGRWGDSRNPLYGALTDNQFIRSRAHDKKLLEDWIIPLRNVEDVHEKFKDFCHGKLRSNPWSESDGFQPESMIINEQLGRINIKGFLTINSQPAVNGAKSDCHIGGPGGYVYQKGYLEFFCSKEKLDALVSNCSALPSLTYMAMNKEGTWISNISETNVSAVTWGVFPQREIIQPTVVDPASFLVWKDEAFEIWSRGWASLYPEDDPSKKVLEESYSLIVLRVQNNYFLVSLVDNDYINGDLFAVFADL